MSRKEEFSKLGGGLRSDLRNYIDDIVRIKRGLTRGAALMTMEEAYNLCFQKEISLQRDRQDAYRHRMFAAFNAFAARNSYRASAKPTQQTNPYAAAIVNLIKRTVMERALAVQGKTETILIPSSVTIIFPQLINSPLCT